MSHTPTPWHLTEHSNGFAIKSQDTLIANIQYDHETPLTATVDNAAHIVRCVNVHNQLVDALKTAGNVLAALAIGDLKAIQRDSPALARVRQALAAAEKGA